MIIGPSHTLDDISREFEKQFPHLFLLFYRDIGNEASGLLPYSHTIPEVGTRITKEKEFPISVSMRVEKFSSDFFVAYALNASVCFSSPDEEVHSVSAKQQNMTLGELEKSLASAGYLKFPRTDKAYVDESEKESIEDSLRRIAEETPEYDQGTMKQQPKSTLKRKIIYLAGVIFFILAIIKLTGILGE